MSVLTAVKHPKIKRAIERPLYVKALIYGEPGAGKTWLSCTAPNPLILLTEPGVADATIRAATVTLGREPSVWEISDINDISEAYEYLATAGHKEFDTVVLDSVTDMYRRITRSVIDYTVERAMKSDRVKDPDVPEQGDWFRIAERIRKLIMAFRNLPMHVVVTALVMDVRNELLRVPFVQPKSLALELPAFFNVVGYLGVVNEDGKAIRKLLVERTETHLAKNPGNILPPIITAPDLTDIFETIIKNTTPEVLQQTAAEGDDSNVTAAV